MEILYIYALLDSKIDQNMFTLKSKHNFVIQSLRK